MNSSVGNLFQHYPIEFREPLLQLRQLIYHVASQIPEVGELAESLKWGQPTFSTVKPKTGSPIRLDRFDDDNIALFFHCQTSLVDSFRVLFQHKLKFS